MKNYLTLAAVLGAIAFLSVSYLAQAEPEAAAAAPVAVEKAVDTPAAPAMDAEAMMAKDKADCDAMAAMPTTEGAEPTAEQKEAAAKKCMEDKGHPAEAPKAEEGAAPAPAAEGTAPAAEAPKK